MEWMVQEHNPAWEQGEVLRDWRKAVTVPLPTVLACQERFMEGLEMRGWWTQTSEGNE